MDLAVIIVSWNTRELTLDALRTLFGDLNSHGPDADVWVVDCASADGTPQAIQQGFPQVRLVASDKNLGFAGANNHVLRMLGFGADRHVPIEQLPKAVYLLNPDTRTHAGTTRTLYDALFSLPKAGVVGARLQYGDGAFQHGAFEFPGLRQLIIDLFPIPLRLHETKFNGRYPRQLYESGKPFPVDHTLGATMMIRREVILQTGMFDEAYFMYCEEIDWSIRIRNAGWEIYTIPQAVVTHLAGQSTGQIKPQSIVNLWRSRLRLFEKHYSPTQRVLARGIIRMGMRFQIARANRALKRHDLTPAEHAALVTAYQTVLHL